MRGSRYRIFVDAEPGREEARDEVEGVVTARRSHGDAVDSGLPHGAEARPKSTDGLFRIKHEKVPATSGHMRAIRDRSENVSECRRDVDGLDRPFRTVSAPLHLTGSEHGVRGRAPDHGEHTAAVLAEAGLSEDQIADLLARGVVITDGLD